MGRSTEPRASVNARVRLKAYPIVQRAVEEGAAYGVNRAFKHTDAPTREGIVEAVVMAVMGDLCEVMDFDD